MLFVASVARLSPVVRPTPSFVVRGLAAKHRLGIELRDLYYGYDTLMENVSDPSHIDIAHHKVTGRRDRAKPLPFKMEATGPWGFAGANDGNPKITAKFVAPCYYLNNVEPALLANKPVIEKKGCCVCRSCQESEQCKRAWFTIQNGENGFHMSNIVASSVNLNYVMLMIITFLSLLQLSNMHMKV